MKLAANRVKFWNKPSVSVKDVLKLDNEGHKIVRALSTEEIIALGQEKSQKFISLQENFQTPNDKITVQCFQCETLRTTSLQQFKAYKNGTCPTCNKKVRIPFILLSPQEVKDYITNTGHKILDMSGYKKSTDRILIRCGKCDHERNPTFSAFKNYKNGSCPVCVRNAERKTDIIKLEKKTKKRNHIIVSIQNYKN